MSEELDALLEFRPAHLGWPFPADIVERIGVEDALFWLRNRKAEIEKAERDPLRHGYEPKIWFKAWEQIKDLRKAVP